MNPAGQGIDLSGLRDIHLPDLPSVWPLAWGWWALAGSAVLCAVVVKMIFIWRRKSAKRYALSEADRLVKQYADKPHALVSETSLLLKRIALLRFPKEGTAGLYGKQWRGFLERTSKKPLFNGKAGEMIENAMYIPPERFYERDVTPLIDAAKEWIRENA